MPENTPYNPVTPAIAAELRGIAGDPNVLYGEPERMLDYAHDEPHSTQYTHMPEVVVKPDDGTQPTLAQVGLAGRRDPPPRFWSPSIRAACRWGRIAA